jgi:hypothetical protein
LILYRGGSWVRAKDVCTFLWLTCGLLHNQPTTTQTKHSTQKTVHNKVRWFFEKRRITTS